jgi:hypothetical protein
VLLSVWVVLEFEFFAIGDWIVTAFCEWAAAQ